MTTRTNEAKWSEYENRWTIKVQRNLERKKFVSSKKHSKKTDIKGKIEAERKADAWLAAENKEAYNNKARVAELLDKYEEKLIMSTSKGHYTSYQSIIRNHIRPAIGHKRINSLVEADLQYIIDNAYKKNKLAHKTLRNIKSCISNFIKYCRSLGATTFRPEFLTIPLSAKRSEKKILDFDDLVKLFSIDTTISHNKREFEPLIYLFRFLVLTGLRPGEALGLKHSDIKENICYIQRSVNSAQEITQGKNKNARRVFQLPVYAQRVLEDQNEYLKEVDNVSEYIFPDPCGMPLKQPLVYEHLRRFCRSNDFDTVVSVYELRHTYNSMNDEMPDRLRKMVMGHSATMDTNKVYSHEKKKDMKLIAMYTDSAFNDIMSKVGTKVGT